MARPNRTLDPAMSQAIDDNLFGGACRQLIDRMIDLPRGRQDFHELRDLLAQRLPVLADQGLHRVAAHAMLAVGAHKLAEGGPPAVMAEADRLMTLGEGLQRQNPEALSPADLKSQLRAAATAMEQAARVSLAGKGAVTADPAAYALHLVARRVEEDRAPSARPTPPRPGLLARFGL